MGAAPKTIKEGKMNYHWKEPRIWGIGVVLKNKDSNEPLAAETVTLLPGLHEMPDEEWDKIKDRDEIKERISNGQLEVKVEVKADGKKAKLSQESGLPEKLEGFETQKAVSMVSGTMDVDQLKKWKKSDKRKVVKDAIDAQLKAIEYATKPKKQED